MSIDENGRKSRASKAGIASGKARHPKSMTKRDHNIVLAYNWLSGNPQSKLEMIEAINFLNNTAGGCNLKPGETPLSKIANITRLTKPRIHQIVNQAKSR